jgi:hypothetical protein
MRTISTAELENISGGGDLTLSDIIRIIDNNIREIIKIENESTRFLADRIFGPNWRSDPNYQIELRKATEALERAQPGSTNNLMSSLFGPGGPKPPYINAT